MNMVGMKKRIIEKQISGMTFIDAKPIVKK